MTPDAKTFQDWADKGHWTNWERKPERAHLLRHLITAACMELGPNETMGSTALVEKMLPGLDTTGRNYITGGMNYLRKQGELEEYFKRGPKNGRTFGHASIVWFNPTLNGADGLEGLL